MSGTSWIIGALALALAGPVLAAPYTPVWIDRRGELTDSALETALQQVAGEQPDPRHIVVLVHGYDMSRKDSAQAYAQVAERCRAAFSERGQNVALVGLQWESEVEGPQFLPWVAVQGYMHMVPRARGVGRQGARQLLLGLQGRFPNASLDIFAHSMGCEIANAAMSPQLAYREDAPAAAAFQPERDIRVNLLALLGSDLDYDADYKGDANYALDRSRCQLIWMTISNYLIKEDQDRSLADREILRGTAAGDAFPRMRAAHYDQLFSNRQLYLEDRNIPPNHEMQAYYSPERVERLIANEIYLADPSAPKPPELADLDAILAAPNRERDLVPWLDSPDLAPRSYALWRLEHLLCGGSQHFEDESLIKVARLLRHYPHHIWGQREKSPCQSIARGYWPTEKQMTRAGAPSWGRPR